MLATLESSILELCITMKSEIFQITSEDIQNIAQFAKPIWHEHYSPIIGKNQVIYMLDKFQSEKAIKQQLLQGYRYYKVLNEDQLVGYFSIQQRDNSSLFVSKFYLDKSARGSGMGRKMLSFIERLANESNCKTIDLTVNKENPAYEIYLKLGFKNQGSAEFDIGNGYIMDDYLMSKDIPS